LRTSWLIVGMTINFPVDNKIGSKPPKSARLYFSHRPASMKKSRQPNVTH
jgi:hypothetical protein